MKLWPAALCLLWLACGDAPAAPDASPGDAGIDAVPRPDARPPSDAAPSLDAAPPPAGDTCANPVVLAAGAAHTATTTGYPHTATGTCSPGTSAAGDAVIAIDVGTEPLDLVAEVVVDEGVDAPYDVVLHARSGCAAPPTELACRDSGWGETLEVLGALNTIYLFIDGTSQYGGTRTGEYSLSTRTRQIAAEGQACDALEFSSRCDAGLRCVSGTCTADSPALACSEAVDVGTPTAAMPFSLVRSTHAYGANHHEGSCRFETVATAAEHLYRIVLSAAGTVTASTDAPETNFDTVLYLRQGTCDGAELACADDISASTVNLKSTLIAADLPAGTYYLIVDGSSATSASGTYSLTVSVE